LPPSKEQKPDQPEKHGRYDKIDLPVVRPRVTKVGRYTGHCPCCGGVTLAPVSVGMEDGSPFRINQHGTVPSRCDRNPNHRCLERLCARL
jgi:hypothetical protein